MTANVGVTPATGATEVVRVRVDRTGRGRWDVEMPDHHRMSCETLDDARRIAFLSAANARPCELIVHDAYHRVVQHELIDAHGS